MKKYLTLPLLALFLLPFSIAQAHDSTSNGGRGGLPDLVDEAALSQYITDGSLKASMLNYLRTIQLKLVPKNVRGTLEKMLQNGALEQDIMSRDNYVVGLDKCTGHDSVQDAMAWTTTGQSGRPNIGGVICFDVHGLVQQFKASGLGVEDSVIKIAALAFHEHTHHFQAVSDDAYVIQAQENEANAIGGYVELTAKIAQVPLLRWSIHAGMDDGLAKQVFSCASRCGYYFFRYYGEQAHVAQTCEIPEIRRARYDPYFNAADPNDFMMSTGDSLEDAFNAIQTKCKNAGGFLYDQVESTSTAMEGARLGDYTRVCKELVLTSPLAICH